jgi:hypothetical protein
MICGGGTLAAVYPKWQDGPACALEDFAKHLVSLCKKEDVAEIVVEWTEDLDRWS